MLWSDVNAIYQIYPRSFFDASGDGVGDLKGITQKLGYIKGDTGSLGVDAIWISPFFVSPMKDFGYDVSDYCDVDPLFGTLGDFDELLSMAHSRGIKVMIDYVPNHTSDQHNWFLESRSSRDNYMRDWYVWRDPNDDGSPPNNWLSVFGGSAWEFDQSTGQYYLHSFLSSQPDLNWANPEVQDAMADVIRFWMDRGVDGLRADAVRWMSKNAQLADNPINPYYRPAEEDPYHEFNHVNSRYGSSLFEYLKIIADTVAEYDNRIVLFEDYIDESVEDNRYEQYRKFYSIKPGVAAPFNLDGIKTPYNADAYRSLVDGFQLASGGLQRPYYCFGNHDQSRLVSRIGFEQARLTAMMQLTLPGTPIIYYGDEIAMHDVDIPPEMVKDPPEIRTPGLGLGRDPSRTPMQWNSLPHAGFSTVEPWLPLADDYEHRSVATESAGTNSTLKLYQNMLGLRKSELMRNGLYIQWFSNQAQLFGYIREKAGERMLVVFNVSENEFEWDEAPAGEIVFSTHATRGPVGGKLNVLPHQGLIIYLSQQLD